MNKEKKNVGRFRGNRGRPVFVQKRVVLCVCIRLENALRMCYTYSIEHKLRLIIESVK